MRNIALFVASACLTTHLYFYFTEEKPLSGFKSFLFPISLAAILLINLNDYIKRSKRNK